MAKNAVDWIALLLVIIGGLNWGLVGLFNLDLVAAIFGAGSIIFKDYIHTCWTCSTLHDLLRYQG